jgi:hypothetical protein
MVPRTGDAPRSWKVVAVTENGDAGRVPVAKRKQIEVGRFDHTERILKSSDIQPVRAERRIIQENAELIARNVVAAAGKQDDIGLSGWPPVQGHPPHRW